MFGFSVNAADGFLGECCRCFGFLGILQACCIGNVAGVLVLGEFCRKCFSECCKCLGFFGGFLPMHFGVCDFSGFLPMFFHVWVFFFWDFCQCFFWCL